MNFDGYLPVHKQSYGSIKLRGVRKSSQWVSKNIEMIDETDDANGCGRRKGLENLTRTEYKTADYVNSRIRSDRVIHMNVLDGRSYLF